ncbi:hypothetical protein G6F40_015230 [Rhizopus arrhizus]|nr:hypothetical protein G6F40_015230 [Rhizopus arrhizus]
MEKPDLDHIEGLSPAISIEQKSTSHNPRSTVGTITEIYDYLRLLTDGQPAGRPGAAPGPGTALHAAGAGHPRPQGRARAGVRPAARAGLRARARGRRAA